jgi:acyl transferase domain-containing protein/NAD(P)-dependent dehydrogenase (short-subunit alcohol dehydrogenase family)/SAM-dependent methyltransferase/acyl carrier protein
MNGAAGVTRPLGTDDVEPIAIVAMSGRFPGAATVDEFWANLTSGIESISRFDPTALIALGRDPAVVTDSRFVAAEAVLDGYDRFDAEFFGYAPREAEIIDPQHRICLEAVWTAFDSIGYDPMQVPGSVGVFLSASLSSYLIRNLLADRRLLELLGGFPVLIHNDKDFLATTVSHKLGLTGPSLVVGSACSSSLVAVHLAVQSLLGYECDMAVAGGSSLLIPQPQGYLYREDGIYSPDGYCRPFSSAAHGTVGGSGVGVVLLKRFRDAVHDGDPIHALIAGSAVNNDGAAKVGYTAPGVDGQAAVVAEALAVSGIPADEIGYLEAHGTGTPLGDAVEIEALTSVYAQHTRRRQYCPIGSVKSNIGHLDAAAGVAGLIKAVLAVENGIVPASLHCLPTNESIDFAATPFRPVAETETWSTDGHPRSAGVSAFGIGGTNAHMILRAAPAPVRAPADAGRRWHPIVLSGRDGAAVRAAATDMAKWLQTRPVELASVATTLVGRCVHPVRAAVVADDPSSAATALVATVADAGFQPAPSTVPPVLFCFPGLGAEPKPTMDELFREDPTWRRHAGECRALPAALGIELDDPSIDLLTSFTVEYATAATLLDFGVRPAAVLGHEMGEYPAAVVAGVLSLSDALRLASVHRRLLGARQTTSVESIADRFRAEVTTARLTPARIPVAAPTLGRWADPNELSDPEYWVQRLRRGMRFDDALGAMLAAHDSAILLDVGLRTSLPALVHGHRAVTARHRVIATQSPAAQAASPSAALMRLLAELWTAGVPVDWSALTGAPPNTAPRARVPGYPFQRERHWVEQPDSTPTIALDALLSDTPADKPVADCATAAFSDGLDRLCGALAFEYLDRGGLATQPGARYPVAELRDRLGVLPQFHRMLEFMLDVLAEDGVLDRVGGEVIFSHRPPAIPAAAWERELISLHPNHRGLVDLVTHCVSHYPDALTKPGVALSVLYPDSETTLLDRTIGTEDANDEIAGRIATLVDIAVRFADRVGRPLRVLEVGAGGGRLTAVLATALHRFRVDYLATDVGRTFTSKIARAAAQRQVPLRTAVFDITGDPAAQGIPRGGFDLVVGLDVVHATPNVRETLRGLLSLLAPGGLLGVIETTARDRWLSMVWGLSDGWWSFRDGFRTTSPLLDGAGWRQVVADLTGARGVVLPDRPDAAAALILLQAPLTISAVPDGTASGVLADILAKIPGKQPDIADWCYVAGWRRVPTPAPELAAADLARGCLVLSAGPVGDAVVAALRRLDVPVTVARPIGAPADPGDLVIDPADPAAYRPLVGRAGTTDLPPRAIAHLWLADIDLERAAALDPEAARRAQTLGLHSLLLLTQVIGAVDAAAKAPVRLVVTTSAAADVLGGELVHPEQATAHAAAKVIPREYPQLSCTALDLPGRAGQVGNAELAEWVCTELFAGRQATLVAYRGKHCWLPTMEPVRLPARDTDLASGLVPGGVYLICGGLGGIGLGLAERLAALPATVVLTRRNPFPPPEQWSQWQQLPGEEAPTGALIRRLVAATGNGGRIVVEQADITSLPDLRAVVDRTVACYGAITGVIHAAGVPDEAGMIQRRTVAATEAAMAAKVAGTLALEQALAGQRPRFLLLCSSIGVLLPNLKFGEVGYLAGHEFSNAYAAYASARSDRLTISIGWTDWLEAGMWAQAQRRLARRYASAPAGLLDADLLRGITNAEGATVFERVLRNNPAPHVVISTQRLDELLAVHDAYTVQVHDAVVGKLTATCSSRQRDPRADQAPPRSGTERTVAAIWEELLGVDQVGADDDFFALGGDSLLALRFLALLRERTGVDYSIARMFETSTLRSVVEAVEAAEPATDDVVAL